MGRLREGRVVRCLNPWLAPCQLRLPPFVSWSFASPESPRGIACCIYFEQRLVWSESGTTLVIWSLKKRNRLIGPDPWIRLNSYRSLPDQIQIRSIPDSYRSITDQINSMQRAFGDHLAPPGPVCLRGYICIDLTLYLSVLSISKPALRSYLNTNSETITKHLLGASVSTKACVSTKTCAARGTFALACRVRVSTCTN